MSDSEIPQQVAEVFEIPAQLVERANKKRLSSVALSKEAEVAKRRTAWDKFLPCLELALSVPGFPKKLDVSDLDWDQIGIAVVHLKEKDFVAESGADDEKPYRVIKISRKKGQK